MVRACSILAASSIVAVAGLALVLGAGSASAAESVFMSEPLAKQLVREAAPASDLRTGPGAPALLGLGQPELGVRPEVLALSGASKGDEQRIRLSDAFYRQGLVIAPGPVGAARGEGSEGLVDLVASRMLTGAAVRPCAFACIGALAGSGWLEAAPRPAL